VVALVAEFAGAASVTLGCLHAATLRERGQP
jgi:hypothetical protein